MSNLTFKDYTDAAVAALTGLTAANGGLVKTLKAYGGEIAIRPEGIYYYAERPTPCILVQVGQAAYVPGGHPYHTQTVSLRVYLVVTSLRSEADAFEDAAAILDGIRRLLLRQSLREGLLPLLLDSEQHMDSSPDYVFYLATYTFVNPRIAEA